MTFAGQCDTPRKVIRTVRQTADERLPLGVRMLFGRFELLIDTPHRVLVSTPRTRRSRIDRLFAPVLAAVATLARVRREAFAPGGEGDIRLLLVVAEVGTLIAGAVIGTTLSKIASGFASGAVYELTPRRSLRVGLGLVPRGEFSLIIAALASTSGVTEIQKVVPAFTVGYVLVMSILGPIGISILI